MSIAQQSQIHVAQNMTRRREVVQEKKKGNEEPFEAMIYMPGYIHGPSLAVRGFFSRRSLVFHGHPIASLSLERERHVASSIPAMLSRTGPIRKSSGRQLREDRSLARRSACNMGFGPRSVEPRLIHDGTDTRGIGPARESRQVCQSAVIPTQWGRRLFDAMEEFLACTDQSNPTA